MVRSDSSAAARVVPPIENPESRFTRCEVARPAYRVRTQIIPSAITPKNRLLIGTL
jgi:hypothetical protein